jgi:STE24 endopeptidase
VYTDFIREHQYCLSTQTFGAWMGDTLKDLAVTAITVPLAMMALYGVLRRSGRQWWVWGALVTIALMIVMVAISPVYIAPIFNTYTPLKPSPIRDEILRVAHANGIRAEEVYQVDASRQTTRVSANVSGILGTQRITLNDNLLNRASPGAILAVLGHEMGHYVLNHVYKMLLAFGVIIVVGFAIVAWGFDRLAARHASRWGVLAVEDPAGFPLIVLLLSTYIFLLTPVVNTVILTNEFEADVFGLNATRQPEGFAEAALLLSDYRKMDPGPLEEIVFYDHPSGRTRIFTAMQWKAYSKP